MASSHDTKPSIADPEAACTCVTNAATIAAVSANCPLHGFEPVQATEPTCKSYGAGHRCTLPEGHDGTHHFDTPLNTTTNMPSLAPREHKLLFLAGADAERARIRAYISKCDWHDVADILDWLDGSAIRDTEGGSLGGDEVDDVVKVGDPGWKEAVGLDDGGDDA
jgi:hypothetical protein